MKAYKSIHTGEIGTQFHWLDRIATYNREANAALNFDDEVLSGDLVPVWLELMPHKFGKTETEHTLWTAFATDDDDNRYVVNAICEPGKLPAWDDLDVISIEEE